MLKRHLLLSGRLSALLLHRRSLIRALYLHVTEKSHDLVLQSLQQALKQCKRLALVFLLGVFVGLSPQMDALPQLIHHL